ncbi:hypothetical protein [Amycolatopsis sp. GM8]|uniref:hypothetical protein n=1 Tax=Amycolatopsis sp. GM8 TaxID=2896530 RepID=UPI001F3A0C31|nr:hypothetical protein [Amycolatopsis sp. GM8]
MAVRVGAGTVSGVESFGLIRRDARGGRAPVRVLTERHGVRLQALGSAVLWADLAQARKRPYRAYGVDVCRCQSPADRVGGPQPRRRGDGFVRQAYSLGHDAAFTELAGHRPVG